MEIQPRFTVFFTLALYVAQVQAGNTGPSRAYIFEHSIMYNV